jgi:endonuclease-8
VVLAGRGGCGVAGVAASDEDGRPLHHRRGAAVRAPQRPQGCAEEGEEHAGVVRDDGGAEEQHREDGEHRGHACHAHLLVVPHGTHVGRPVPGYRHIVPEGDTVYLAGKRLHAALAGRLLVRGELRHPRLAEEDLAGRTVLGVRSVGKHMLTRFDDGRSLHSHFRMDGSWHLYRPGMAWRRPAYEARAVLATADRVAVGFALHDLELLPTNAEDRVVGHLGPDLLDPEWDDTHAAEALRRFTARRDHELGLVLLEQRVMAGVGNLYKAEVCFLLGLSPWTLVRDVPDPARAVALSRELLLRNKDRPEQSTTGELGRGRQHWVFERGRQRCFRCGTRIAVGEQGDGVYARIAYWCPRCQPGPSPALLHGAAARTARSRR